MYGISAAVILDIVLVLLLSTSIVIGAHRGLLKSFWKVISLVLTIFLVFTFKTPFSSVLSQTSVSDKIYSSISEKITPVFSDSLNNGEKISLSQKKEIASTLHLPTVVVAQVLSDYDAQAVSIGSNRAINRAVDNIARSITMLIMGFISAVLLFILIKILLFILYHILNAMSKLPVIHGTNHFLGMMAGLLNSLFIIYIICAIISFIATDNSSVYQMIEETYIVKYFYNYNILLQLFMKA